MSDALLLIGTRKGLFVARSADGRRSWQIDDIRQSTNAVYTVGIDARGDAPRLFASTEHGHFGPTLLHSDDLGHTWSEPDAAPVAFPEGSDTSLVRIWQVVPGSAAEPDVVYAGVEPHALFRSTDGGLTFSLVTGLFDHPHRPQWVPGNGGACLHTVLPHPDDPQRMLVAMSAAGVYSTTDGGASWSPANDGIQAYWMPEDQRYPEFGQCVHRVAQHPGSPERLFAQNHFGVYRSDDWGGSWKAVEDGLPANFGFPIAVHPRRPETVFTIPLAGDGNRMPADNRLRVFRSADAGSTWESASAGLPESPYYSAVLRDAMCVDDGDPSGVYFGTRAGDVFASTDAGDSWQCVVADLPDVFSVRAVTLH